MKLLISLQNLTIFIIPLFLSIRAEILPTERLVDWSNAGVVGDIPDYPVQHSVSDFGAAGDGATDARDAFLEAIENITEGNALVVPAGT